MSNFSLICAETRVAGGAPGGTIIPMRVCIRTRLTDDQNATSSTRQDARLSPTDKRGDETVITKSSENATMTFSGGFRGGPSRLRPPPLLGDGPTPSLMVMLANAKF